jgi:hypothetical protein
LLTEYLNALIAENVLDSAAAGQIADAYNRTRYAAEAGEQTSVSEATAALQQVSTNLTAMTAEARQQLAERIRDRVAVPGEVEPYAGNRNGEGGARNTPVPLARQVRFESEQGTSHLGLDEQSSTSDSFATVSPPGVRWRTALRRRSLELSAIGALGIFFFGYFFRELADRSLDPDTLAAVERKLSAAARAEAANSRLTGQLSRPLADAISSRGLEESQRKHFGKARLAYQLLFAYFPDDPYVLNNLAWVYLFPDNAGATDPQRSLQLSARAVELNRDPAFLDTAAEAQFQCGHREDAIRLEQEAMLEAYDNESSDLAIYQRQLQKYRNSPDSPATNQPREAAER